MLEIGKKKIAIVCLDFLLYRNVYNTYLSRSLGCTVVEMLTAECPYAYEKYLPSVIITIGMGIPPETGQSLSTRMKNLLQKTLCADPFKRLGAKNILKVSSYAK